MFMRVLVHNEQMNCLRMHKRLLTNRLHGKAAELCKICFKKTLIVLSMTVTCHWVDCK